MKWEHGLAARWVSVLTWVASWLRILALTLGNWTVASSPSKMERSSRMAGERASVLDSAWGVGMV